MIKRQKDLIKGDIIRVEFGDYDHFVTVVVDSIEDDGTAVYNAKILCHYLDGRKEEMYGDPNSLVNVIGREE